MQLYGPDQLLSLSIVEKTKKTLYIWLQMRLERFGLKDAFSKNVNFNIGIIFIIDLY